MVIILRIDKIKWYNTIRFKLLSAFIFISTASICIFSIMYYVSFKDYCINQRKELLLNKAIQISDEIIKNNDLNYEKIAYHEKMNIEFNDISKNSLILIRVMDSNGIIVRSSEKNEEGKTFEEDENIKDLRTEEVFILDLTNKQISLYLPIVENENNQTADSIFGIVYMTSSIEDISDLMLNIGKTVFIVIWIVLFFELVLSLYISKIIVKPLAILKKNIDKITQGYLDEKVVIKSKDEIAEIGNTINKMTDRLLQIDDSRKEFVSNVSHELKTPLSSIKVLVGALLIQDNVSQEIYREFLFDIDSEIDRQNEIINDLLQLVKLDEKKLELKVEMIDINYLLKDIVKRLHPLALEKNIDLVIEDIETVFIEADSLKMTLALFNIIENAIKYNIRDGKVTISIDRDKYNGYITVSDTGIGIPVEHQDKIFERFYRVDKMRARTTGGTGLGLAISRGVIQRHNGSINVISKEKIGATFLLALPLKQTNN